MQCNDNFLVSGHFPQKVSPPLICCLLTQATNSAFQYNYVRQYSLSTIMDKVSKQIFENILIMLNHIKWRIQCVH